MFTKFSYTYCSTRASFLLNFIYKNLIHLLNWHFKTSDNEGIYLETTNSFQYK